MPRRSVVTILDVLTVGLAVLAATIVNVGGFILRFSDVRLSFRSPSGTLLWLTVVVVVRLMLDRRRPPFGVSRNGWRRLFLRTDDNPIQICAAPGVWRRAMLTSFGIGLALAIVVHDQLRQPYSVADLGDPLFSIWRMQWVLHQLVADPSHLFDGNIFYPQRLVLTLSDPLILPALTAAPLIASGGHPVVVYNAVLLSGFWFSGIATYLLVERLTASARAAFIAGLMYACYPYRFEHYGHLELQMTQWMPLGLLAVHLFVSTRRWPYALAFALAGVAQLYSSMYYAVFFLVYVLVIGVGLLMIHRPSLRSLVLPVTAAALVAGVIAVPIVRAFVAAQPLKGDRTVDEIRYYSAKPSDYLRAHQRSALWKNRMLAAEPERALFPGVAPLALGAIGLAPPLSAVRLVYAAGLLLSIDASFGFNGRVYPYLHGALAPIRGLRVPARFSALVGLTLCILGGFGVHRVLRWCRSRWRQHAVFAALIVGVVIDAWPALTLAPVWKDPPPIYQGLEATPGVVLAELPAGEDELSNLPFMYFSVSHWTPMVNGYSGFIPASYATVAPVLRDFPRGNTVAALRDRGVTHVTVNCGLSDRGCEETVNLIRQHGELRLIAEARWQGESVQLYRLSGK